MKQYNKRSFLLLSLLFLSTVLPSILVNSNIEVKNSSAKIFVEEVFDFNGDNIQDEFMDYVEKKGETIIKAVVLFDHKINGMDKYRLTQKGASISSDVWDLGRRILVTTHSDNLELIGKIPGVSLITSAEKRTIIVVIEGNDYSDLEILEQFDGSMIFWGIGCAYVPYYSGIENDIDRLGDYSIIADMTDIKFYPQSTSKNTENIVFNTATADTAEYINATALWDDGYDGSTAKVGVMDTGINIDHNDIAGRVIEAQSFVLTIYGHPEDDPTTTDYEGHGSHVTGIIAADGTNNPDYIGMAPDTNIYFAKIGDPATSLCVIAALDWLVNDLDVDVINYSYGAEDEVGVDVVEATFRNAIRNKNVVCVTSTGNEGYEGFYSVGRPASLDDIISVGNLDTTGIPFEIAQTSSKGPTSDNHMKPDILAPGTEIMSLAGGGQGYESRGGTSMASPHVVGGIALLIDACKDKGISYNPGLLKAAIMNTAAKLPSDNILSETLGLIDVGQAWHYIENAPEVSGYPLVGACNPYKLPLPFWETIIQGQRVEQFLTCVSPYKNSLSLEFTGTAAPLITYELYQIHYTTLFRLVINVTKDTPLGIYTGQVNFKYSTNVLDTAEIEFEVVAGSGKRILLNFRTTKDKENHENFGRYNAFIDDAYSSGYAICDENVYLDSGVLSQYDAVWIPDPFNYYYPEAYNYTVDVIETWNPWTENEKLALTSYV
ncbi:MAG: S8 family serine peptidase, partial [Asgard group archaeon]|nr:S8 family serine peptidase [Asgard group archaeon]